MATRASSNHIYALTDCEFLEERSITCRVVTIKTIEKLFTPQITAGTYARCTGWADRIFVDRAEAINSGSNLVHLG